jgi:hypothetical protein
MNFADLASAYAAFGSASLATQRGTTNSVVPQTSNTCGHHQGVSLMGGL